MKEKLTELVQALIKGDSKKAEEALHEYLTLKTRTILAEADIVVLDDDDDDEEMDYDEEGMGDEGDLEDEMGDEEGLGDLEDEMGDEEGLGDEEGMGDEGDMELDDEEGMGDEGDVDVNLDLDDEDGRDVDVNLDLDDDEESEEYEEKLLRRGRRTDKASTFRLRR